jgi:hypothetical protein
MKKLILILLAMVLSLSVAYETAFAAQLQALEDVIQESRQQAGVFSEAMKRQPVSGLKLFLEADGIPRVVAAYTKMLEDTLNMANEGRFPKPPKGWPKIWSEEIKTRMENYLADFDSAKFQFGMPQPVVTEFTAKHNELAGTTELIHYGYKVPFFVNAKNKQGAYVGKKPMQVLFVDGLSWVEEGHDVSTENEFEVTDRIKVN